MPTSLLRLVNATVSYPGFSVFQHVNLTVSAGEWLCLLGPNGSGKTTLLKALAGVLSLREGTRECTAMRIGYVPQRFLPPTDPVLTLEEFLALAPRTEVPNDYRRHLLTHLGIESLMKQPLRACSSGQLQRALLAFSLWNKPDILFLDEYLEGIDVNGLENITGLLEMMHHNHKMTVIEVSHDLASVVHVASRILVVRNSILFDGSPKDHGFHECLHQVYGHHHWIRHDE